MNQTITQCGFEGNQTSRLQKQVVPLKGNSITEFRQFFEEATSNLSQPIRREVIKVSERVANMEWETPELKEKAVESFEGLFLAVDNRMPKQIQLHSQNLELICNYNDGQKALRILQPIDHNVKPFAVCVEARKTLEVEGDRCTWRLFAADISGELVPGEHLRKLSAIRANGIEPDSLYVGVPYSEKIAPVSRVIVNELLAALTGVSTGLSLASVAVANKLHKLSEIEWLADPLLIAAFGKRPVVLIEIGRWI